MRGWSPVLALTLVTLAARPAQAGPDDPAPTPQWPALPCGLVVDRSVDPVDSIIHFDYTIETEDPAPFPGELPDSRTHQFVAFCRQAPPTEPLPNWLSLDDVLRSELASLIAPNTVASEDILDTSTAWADCFIRVTADADRRPITFAAAEQGVDWVLADVPIGVYQLAGYTFHPPASRWSRQRGFIKIADDLSDPEQDLPAAYLAGIHNGYWWPHTDNGFDLCVDMLAPATAVVEWAPLDSEIDGPSDWQPLGSIPIEQDGMHELAIAGPDLVPPSGYGNVVVEGLLRVRLIDAMSREFTAHYAGTVLYERCVGHCGDDPSEDPPDEDPPDEDTGDELPGDSITDDGCACSHEPSRATPLVWLLLGAAFGLRWRGVAPGARAAKGPIGPLASRERKP